MPGFDRRIARKKDSRITIDGKTYTIGSDCYRGGTALCYSAKCGTDDENYIIKEIYPLRGAKRNEHGDVCIEKHAYLDAFEREVNLMDRASAETYQCAWHYERYDLKKGIGVMRRNAGDSNRLDKAIADYAVENHTPMKRLGWALRVTRALLTGIEKLHTLEKCRFLHLDLSLTNIFISEDKNGINAFFLDFGEAQPLNADNIVPAALAATCGTTSLFGAPERFLRKAVALTPAADVFSASVIFFHLVTAGNWAYRNQPIPDAAALVKMNYTQVEYGLNRLGLPPGTERAVLKVLKKGMASRPDERFQSAGEMLRQVERLIHIVSQRGIFRELILDRSAELYPKTVFYKIAPELEPKIPEPELQHVLYLGDGGCGKTTHLFTHWEKCLQKCKEDFTQPIPIYISVSSFKGLEYQNNFIVDEILDLYINRWEGCQEDGRAELRELLRSGQFLLLLDGFNSSIQPDGLYKELSKLIEYPLLRIYTASRIPFDGRALDCFQQIPVASLTMEQVQHALAKAGRPALAPGRLLETLQRPMFLSLYLRINPKQEDEISTPGEILDAYWDHLIGQFREGNHLDRNTALWDYALNTAFPLLASKSDSLHFQSNQLDGAEYAVGDILHVLKHCGLVCLVRAFRTKPHQWSFTHQIYQEYGKAKWIDIEMDEWEAGDEICSDKILNKGPVEPEVLSLLANIRREHLTDEGGERSIQLWLQQHLAGKQGSGHQMVVRNLIEARKTAHEVDLSGCYDGLDLSLTNFYARDLVGSTFRKAILSEKTFFSPGHRHNITAIAYHKERQWIATASREENQIIIWDSRTQAHIQTIETSGKVIALAMSEKSDQMAWVCRDFDEVAVYDLQTGNKRILPAECANPNFTPFHSDGVLHFCETGLLLHFTSYKYGHISWYLFSPDPQPMFQSIHSWNQTYNGIVISVYSHQGRIGILDPFNPSLAKTIVLWDQLDINSRKMKLTQPITSYAISSGNQYFAYVLKSPENSNEGHLFLYDLSETSSSPQKLGTVGIRAGIVATDEHLLIGGVSIIDEKEPDGIREIPGGIWELKTGRKLPATDNLRFDAAAVMSSEEVAVGSGLTVRILDASTGKIKYEFIGHGVIDYSANIWFLPGESNFCRAFRDGTVAKFSLKDRSCEKIIDGRSLKDGMSVPDADGHRIITVSKDDLRIHSAHTGVQMHHIEGDFSGFERFTLLEAGNILVGESNDHSDILLWDIPGQKATVVHGTGRWAEVLELDVPGRYRKQIRISVNGREPVARPIHAYDYPPHQREKFIRERNALIREENHCRDICGDPTLALLLVKESAPRTMTWVRNIHKKLPRENLLISGHYDGTVKLWTITPDNIVKLSEKILCSEPIEQIELIPDYDGFLAVSRAERVYVCRVENDDVELFSFWDAAPDLLNTPEDQEWKSLVISNDRNDPPSKYRFLAELKPFSKDVSYIPWKFRPLDNLGVLLNHFSGEIIKSNLIDEYDSDHSRWLLCSGDHNTWIAWATHIPFMENHFEVYTTATGDYRSEHILSDLPNLASSALSDDGKLLVAVSTNGDMQIFNTNEESAFLWPKADALDLCGCEFSGAEMDDHLRELLRMNGGIC